MNQSGGFNMEKEAFYHSNQSFLHIAQWQNIHSKLQVGFTTRSGGVSSSPYESFNFGFHVDDWRPYVIKNRQRLAENLSFPLENWVSGEQVHDTNIKIIGEQDKGKGATTNQTSIKGIDGLITNQTGILCTAFYADCAPLYFFDPVTEYIGIAHAGWRGTTNKIAQKMVDTLRYLGVNASNLLAAIGPCISQEYYEIDSRVMHKIDPQYRQNAIKSKGNNRYLLNLKQLNVDILLQSGVLRNNIDVTQYCTFRDNSLFYSHRRENGKTGRMLGYIGYLKE